jgi:protein phosphatase
MSVVSIPEAVGISFASQCDRGKVRDENQDFVLQAAVPLGDLLMVADGIGGYAGGAIASRMAVEVFSSCLAGMPAFFPPAIAIQEAACRAGAEIASAAAQAGTAYSRMGTTVVLALLRQDPECSPAGVQAWIGHIGDSRAYLVHHGRLRRITRDHSAMQLLLDRNLITPEETRHHPDASVLTRALGHDPNVEIELNEVALAPGDTLLLCSDGLWGFVPEKEMESVLADPKLSADEASRALLGLALGAGGHDNVGLQMARLAGTSEPLVPSAPAEESKPAAPFASQAEPKPALAPAAKADLDPVLNPVLSPVTSSIADPVVNPIAGPIPVTKAAPPAAIDAVSALTPEPAPQPETLSESTLVPEFIYVPKFQTAEHPGSSFVKMTMILFLAFAGSCALAYSALIQNWFGIDGLLR